MDEFGAHFYQNFLPYWASTPPATTTPDPLVKISAYLKPNAALVMMANFNEDQPEVEGIVAFDLKTMGLQNIRIRDAFSRKNISTDKGDTLKISIKSFRQAWYILENIDQSK